MISLGLTALLKLCHLMIGEYLNYADSNAIAMMSCRYAQEDITSVSEYRITWFLSDVYIKYPVLKSGDVMNGGGAWTRLSLEPKKIDIPKGSMFCVWSYQPDYFFQAMWQILLIPAFPDPEPEVTH
jgi:hypothetical protein